MKVKELIAELQKLNPEQTVYALCEDEELVGDKKAFEVFMLESVTSAKFIGTRDNDGMPVMKFDNGPDATQQVFLNLMYRF
ncbi:hypothetical protein L1A45_01515 [Acinetobacter variabilis]|uniref:hypothetical protein n=1 Tax=Acinetobacter variabilis TaxID=70346 RepID=UPI00376F4AA0